jgi:hypothetical protein
MTVVEVVSVVNAKAKDDYFSWLKSYIAKQVKLPGMISADLWLRKEEDGSHIPHTRAAHFAQNSLRLSSLQASRIRRISCG